MRADSKASIAKYKVTTLFSKKDILSLEERIPKEEEIIFISPSVMMCYPPNFGSGIALGGVIAFTPKAAYILDTKSREFTPIPVEQIAMVENNLNSNVMGTTMTLHLIDNTRYSFVVAGGKNLSLTLQHTIEQYLNKRE